MRNKMDISRNMKGSYDTMTQLNHEGQEVNGLTLCVPFLWLAFLSSGLWRDEGRTPAWEGKGGAMGELGS